MKNMKRFIMVIMILCLCRFNVCAEGTNMVFSLDISEFTATSATTNVTGIKDATGNSTGLVLKAWNTYKESFTNENGGTTEYIDLTNAGLEFTSKAVTDSLDEITVETWAKINCAGNNYVNLFAISDTASDGDGEMRGHWYKSSSTDYTFIYKAARTENGGTIAYYPSANSYNDKWTHFVFTRKWDAENLQWTSAMYADGKYVAGSTVAGVASNPQSNYLNIGWSEQTSWGMGQISTFNVYNKAMSADEVANMHTATKDNYVALPNTLELVSKPLPQGTIAATQGEFSFGFNNKIDESTLRDGITFTKADGNAIKGKTYITLNGKNVNVKFGKLEDGESYKLTINESLKSLNGKNMAKMEYVYDAKDIKMLLDEDFQGSEFVVGQNPPEGNDLSYYNRQLMTVRATSDGDKYIEIKDPYGWSPKIYKMFDGNIDDFTVEVVAKTGTTNTATAPYGTSPRDIAQPIWQTSATRDYYHYISNTFTLQNGYPQCAAANITPVFAVGEDTDVNGFYSVKIDYTRSDSTNVGRDAVVTNMYDSDKASAKFYTKRSTFEDVYGVVGMHIASSTDAQKNKDYSALSSFRIYTVADDSTPYVLGTEYANKVAKIYVSEDMNPFTVNDANVKVVKAGDSSEVKSTAVYDDTDRSITVTIQETLAEGAEYNVVFTNVVSSANVVLSQSASFETEPGETTVGTVTFTNQDGASIEYLEGVTKLTASTTITNNEDELKDYAAYLAIYNGGTLESVEVATFEDVAKTQTADVSLTVDNMTTTENTTAKLFVWKNGLTPVKSYKLIFLESL